MVTKTIHRPDVLVPYDAFDTDQLASTLHTLVAANEELLATRGLRGLAKRYGDAHDAYASVQRGQADENVQHFAVCLNQEIIGAASVQPTLPLRRLRAVITPALSVGPLAVGHGGLGPNLHAWTEPSPEGFVTLGHAYANLITRASDDNLGTPWTIEPLAAPADVHDQLVQAGWSPGESGRFDDRESRWHIPPLAKLYTA